MDINGAFRYCEQYSSQYKELFYYGPILHYTHIINDELITSRKDEIEKARCMVFGEHWEQQQQGQTEDRNVSSSGTDVEEAEKDEGENIQVEKKDEEEHEQSMDSCYANGMMHNSSSSCSGGGSGDNNGCRTNSTSGCFA